MDEQLMTVEVRPRIVAVLDASTSLPKTDTRAPRTKDRPGHDLRYAIDPSKAERGSGWSPLEHSKQLHGGCSLVRAWWEPIRRKDYPGERLGAGAKAVRLAPFTSGGVRHCLPSAQPQPFVAAGGRQACHESQTTESCGKSEQARRLSRGDQGSDQRHRTANEFSSSLPRGRPAPRG